MRASPARTAFDLAASAIARSHKGGACRMRLAVLAALAGWVGLAEPASALDKVKFATNWLADPEAGGFYQAVADGTYAKYGLDVTIMPGGPQANGGAHAAVRQARLLHGRRHDRRSPVGRGQASAGRRRRRLPEEPADLSCRIRASGWTNGRICRRQAGLRRRRRDQHFLRLAQARLSASRTRASGRTISTPPPSS